MTRVEITKHIRPTTTKKEKKERIEIYQERIGPHQTAHPATQWIDRRIIPLQYFRVNMHIDTRTLAYKHM